MEVVVEPEVKVAPPPEPAPQVKKIEEPILGYVHERANFRPYKTGDTTCPYCHKEFTAHQYGRQHIFFIYFSTLNHSFSKIRVTVS